MKIEARGSEGFIRVLNDSVKFFSDKENQSAEKVSEFVDRYVVSDKRRQTLVYVLSLLVADIVNEDSISASEVEHRLTKIVLFLDPTELSEE